MMASRLFNTLEEVAAHNARIHQQARERKGLGESIAPVNASQYEIVDTKNKFGNVKTADGHASGKEGKRAAELKLLEKAGLISELREQVCFLLIPKQVDSEGKCLERQATYTCDFTYLENGKYVVEDSKSEPTRTEEAYILRRKLMLFAHKIRIRET